MKRPRGHRRKIFLLSLAAAVWFVAFLVAGALSPIDFGGLKLFLFLFGALGMLPFIHSAERHSQQAKDLTRGQFPCFFCGEAIDPEGEGQGVMELHVTSGYTADVRNQVSARYFSHPTCLGAAAHDARDLWADLRKD